MGSAAYRDPLESAVARVDRLEREKAELLALTAGVRRARFRTRAGVAATFAVMLVAAPGLAWIVRGRMPPPPAEAKTYECKGTYQLQSWTTVTTATPSGPMSLTVDPKTGKARGWATGPIGSVRLAGQMRDGQIDVLALSPEGEGRGMGTGRMIGDAMIGGFGVPKMAASASFVAQCDAESPNWKSVAP